MNQVADLPIEALPHEVTDWHIDVLDPVGQSVAFPGQKRIQPEFEGYVKALAANIFNYQNSNPDREFFIATLNADRYRCERIMENKYAARRIRQLPSFQSLNIPLPFQRLLSSSAFNEKGGLIVFCGDKGSGKTSSAAATVRDRLERHSGYCLTVEDPPEFIMRGFHGESGYCEQMDVTNIGFEKALEKSLRCFPAKTNSILYFGEIRNKAAAAELLRIAIVGQLVITTVHAQSIEAAVMRLINLANKDGESEARYLLGSSLKLVIHQTLTDKGLTLEALEVDQTTAAIIGGSQAINLSDAIRRTKNKLQVV